MIAATSEGKNTVDVLTDQDLLGHFAAGRDSAAFEALVRRHGPTVMGVCRRVLGNDHDAEDAFQATFLVLARKANTIHSFQSLAGWLYKVAYRIALRARTSRNTRRVNESRIRAATPAGVMERHRDIAWLVDEEVQRLPEKYRTPVLLCYLQGQTNEQAAQLLRCPTGTIKIRLLRGREMLRKRLVRQGIAGSLLLLLTGELTAAVPPALTHTTALAAQQAAGAGGLASLAVSTNVARLAHQWLRRVALAKMQLASALLLATCLVVLTDRLAQGADGSDPIHPPAAEQLQAPPPLPPSPSPTVPNRPADEWVMENATASQG